MARPSTWTPEQEAFLREHWCCMSDAELARALGTTAGAVRGKRQRLGLVRWAQARKRDWSDEEVAFIRAHWREMTDRQIGEHLGRSWASIKLFRQTRGWTRGYNRFGIVRACDSDYRPTPGQRAALDLLIGLLVVIRRNLRGRYVVLSGQRVRLDEAVSGAIVMVHEQMGGKPYSVGGKADTRRALLDESA